MMDGDSFGGRVRTERLRRGETQGDVAARAGLSISYLSDIERGARSVPTKTALSIAKALSVPVAALLGVDDANQVWPPPGPLNDLLAVSARLSNAQIEALLIVARAMQPTT